ncbi:hypothetical protein ACFST9_00210 [Hymenobacter monticola]|uniref:Uncharacterized protein n=1 Tax=Hymenobacter monticola TaxID=1705399 RepID=A0ABY4BCE4_9BACT|nr:hypothetical protein [Hymenobacter monticola]UOE36815.1 hypothetical protein MTP16_25395 [Hymenobacter monticola]
MQRFLMVLDQTPASAPPPTKYLTTYQLKERGWTATMIAALLPVPDAARAAYVWVPGNALVKLYLRARVEEVEQSDDFLMGQEKATKAKARRGSAARTAQHHVLLKRCVQHFRPSYMWPERWCQRSDWQLSLVDVQAFYDRWEPKFTDLSHAARQRVLDALHEKNRRLFSKRFPEVAPGPQRPKKLGK